MASAPPHRRGRVLAGDPEMLRTMERLLASAGYQPIGVARLPQALAALDRNEPAAVLVGLDAAHADPAGALRALRARAGHVPLLVLADPRRLPAAVASLR